MKGLILAAGRGSRLLPISATRPKHALPIAGVPIIRRAVRALHEAGIHDIGIVTSRSSETDLRDATQGSGHLTFILQPEALGTGDAVLCARDFLEEQPTLLYLGDNLFENSLRPVALGLPGTDAVIGVKQVTNPQAYGVAVVDKGQLRRLVEKPRQPESNLAACGVFAFQPQLMDHLAELAPSERGEIEFPQALTSVLAAGGRVRAVEFKGFWSDAGAPADLLTANAHFLSRLPSRVDGRVQGTTVSGTVVIEAGAVVEDCTLRGPVWIGPHATVRGSTLGPHVSVGPHARISGATVSASLIDEFAHILHPSRPLRNAVVGRHAVISAPSDAGLQLVIGDRSVVRL
ncbi:sugar phosphate nucleotidyltransferase [Deinococcus deserti]|uniref:Putative glucose-1-phosphate thymidylyltransferase n=1 Tax=Deinococcus deserti (strain DSM 17065 / CIP 109153 / LMG 22923 / VCD115) TaxID=546414 RepID=C1CXW1_DEIDV|nr:sugar phosphate nucleotidyltransferase [Deinococcus deserti]ACO46917.1 putative glucose-1-phosphate thymidylyltransferase [Deinococcus deserti VCD115]